jgi:hypothetical protein
MTTDSGLKVAKGLDGLKLLFTMVRDGTYTVEQAMECLKEVGVFPVKTKPLTVTQRNRIIAILSTHRHWLGEKMREASKPDRLREDPKEYDFYVERLNDCEALREVFASPVAVTDEDEEPEESLFEDETDE